jgi:hypothetical protein
VQCDRKQQRQRRHARLSLSENTCSETERLRAARLKRRSLETPAAQVWPPRRAAGAPCQRQLAPAAQQQRQSNRLEYSPPHSESWTCAPAEAALSPWAPERPASPHFKLKFKLKFNFNLRCFFFQLEVPNFNLSLLTCNAANVQRVEQDKNTTHALLEFCFVMRVCGCGASGCGEAIHPFCTGRRLGLEQHWSARRLPAQRCRDTDACYEPACCRWRAFEPPLHFFVLLPVALGIAHGPQPDPRKCPCPARG